MKIFIRTHTGQYVNLDAIITLESFAVLSDGHRIGKVATGFADEQRILGTYGGSNGANAALEALIDDLKMVDAEQWVNVVEMRPA